MGLTKRQKEIIDIVKEFAPITGDDIAEKLEVSRGTIRPDLTVLTMLKILGARPKVGYFHTGKTDISFVREKVKALKIKDFMSIPVVVDDESSVYEGIVTLFLEDIGTIFLTNRGYLSGLVSRKDLLRTALGKYDLNATPLCMIMTRMPNVIYCKEDDNILKVAEIIEDRGIDALPVVRREEEGLKVIGRFTKTNISRLFVEYFKGEL